MKKNVLVIGGSGFLGSHVADELSRSGHNVTIYDLKDSLYRNSNHKFLEGNLLDKDAISSAIKGKDIVYHFAGIADIGEAAENPLLTLECNIMGTSFIADTCVKEGVEHFLFASTVYVYSDRGSFYRVSKQSSEAIVEAYGEKYGLNFTILRYGSLYGPRAQMWNGLKKYVMQAVRENKVEHSGSGDERREYIHVEDAARLSVKALSKKYYGKSLTLTGTQTLTSKELLSMIEEILGKDIEKRFLNEQGKSDHYTLTPYRYSPKPGIKMIDSDFVDLGQGILNLIEECSHISSLEQ